MELDARMAVVETKLAELATETARSRHRLHKLEGDAAAEHAANAALSAMKSARRVGRAELLTLANVGIACVATFGHHLGG